ncbi:MAG TPA: MFS transporter [Acidobacteriaceae bacterium]|jgi:Na+/melibiose symporter-like transporter
MSSSTLTAVERAKTAQRAVATYFLANGMVMGAWVPHVPDRARELHLDPAALGWTLLASGLGAVLAMPLAGRLTARRGSRAVSRVAGIAFPVMLSAVVLAPTALLMGLALLCFGIAGSSMDVSMNAQGIAVEEQLGERTISRLHGMWSIGCFTGAAITSFALSRHVPAWGIVLSFSAVVVLLVAAATPSLFTRAEEGLHDQPLTLRPHGRLLLLGLVAFVSMVCEGSIADWSGLYLRVVRDAGLGVSGYGYAVFAALMVTGRLSGDAIVARLGEERTLLVGGLLAAAGLAVVIGTGYARVPGELWWLLGFALVGAGLANGSPVIYRTAGRVPEVPAGAGIATTVGIGYAGLLAGPPSLGFVGKHAGLTSILLCVLVLCCVMAASARLVRGLAAPAKP